MAFPRNSEGKLDIEAYINLLQVNPEAAQLMEDELVNEDTETINYFYDNLERIQKEIEQRNAIRNEQLRSLNARYAELEAQKQQAFKEFSQSMSNTLNGVKKNNGESLTIDEQTDLADELSKIAIEMADNCMEKQNHKSETQPSQQPKSQAQLEKEEEKRNRALFLYNLELTKKMQAENLQQTTTQPTTKKNSSSKNRGCTIF